MLTLILSLALFSMHTCQAHYNLELLKKENPFSYNLGIKIIPSKNQSSEITICCHGYGHSNQIVDVVDSAKVIPGTLVGFNFPDYSITLAHDHKKTTYGTIHEILPLLYLLKRCVVDIKIPKINLYGFSAGGGAIINALALLNQNTYKTALENIGVTNSVKQQIINALQKGLIILDCPLKSFEEVATTRIKSRDLEILADIYKKNNMQPIDSLPLLSGLHLTILLHFQNPDEILGNRDDKLFIDRLQATHQKKLQVIVGCDGGHNANHASLWNAYKKLNL